MKSDGITKVITIYPGENMNVCTRFLAIRPLVVDHRPKIDTHIAVSLSNILKRYDRFRFIMMIFN